MGGRERATGTLTCTSPPPPGGAPRLYTCAATDVPLCTRFPSQLTGLAEGKPCLSHQADKRLQMIIAVAAMQISELVLHKGRCCS